MSYADALRLDKQDVTITLVDGRIRIFSSASVIHMPHDQSEWPMKTNARKVGKILVLKTPNPSPEYYLIAFFETGKRIPVILETGAIAPSHMNLN